MRLSIKISTYLLSFFMIIPGFNKFFLFLPVENQSEAGKQLIEAFYATGYLIYFIAMIEILAAVLLLFKPYKKIASILLLPITTNILLFHCFLDLQGLPLGIVVFGLNTFLFLNFVDIKKQLL